MAGAGDVEVEEIGADLTTRASGWSLYGVAVEASTDTLLESFALRVSGYVGQQVTLAVFEEGDVPGTWQQLAVTALPSPALQPTWLSSGTVDVPVVAGRTYLSACSGGSFAVTAMTGDRTETFSWGTSTGFVGAVGDAGDPPACQHERDTRLFGNS